MNINTTKIISLLFFIFSAFYLYTAYQIRVFSFDENAPFNAKTFPIYLGYAGLFFSALKIILPEHKNIKIDHKNLEYKKTVILVLIAIIYGITILKIGYFLTTSLFLGIIILCFRGKKMVINLYTIFSICWGIYVPFARGT